MIYDKICLMLPTYKRPESIMSFVNSALNCADDWHRLRFCFCVNKSDTESKRMISESMFWPDADMWEIIEESTDQPNLSLYFNTMYDQTKFNEEETLVTMLGDDMVFMTKGYDTKILETINSLDGKAIVFCNDNYIAKEKLCVNLFTTRKVVKAQDKPFMCEYYHAEMIDVVWHSVGIMTGMLRYLPNVIIQHNHNTKKNKEQWDETFKRISPIQCSANSSENKKLSVAYSTICARKMIEKGVGEWNVL